MVVVTEMNGTARDESGPLALKLSSIERFVLEIETAQNACDKTGERLQKSLESSNSLFTKLCSLRAQMISEKTKGAMKREQERVERVLMRVILTARIGRSARAIARDCLVLSFVFGNTLAVFAFFNQLLNAVEDFIPKRRSVFKGGNDGNASERERVERFFGVCECVEAIVWTFGKTLGKSLDVCVNNCMKVCNQRAHSNDVDGLKLTMCALKLATRCVASEDAKFSQKTCDDARKMIKRVFALDGGKRQSTEVSRATQEAKRRALELRAAMLMNAKRNGSLEVMKQELEAFNGQASSSISEVEMYTKGKNMLNLIAETKNLGNSGTEILSAFATLATAVEDLESNSSSSSNSAKKKKKKKNGDGKSNNNGIDGIGHNDFDDEETYEEDYSKNATNNDVSVSIQTCFISPLFETSEVSSSRDFIIIKDTIARAWMRYSSNMAFNSKSYSVDDCTRDIVQIGFASKLQKNDCFAAACGLAVLRVAVFEKRIDEGTRKQTLKLILDILRGQIVSDTDEKKIISKKKSISVDDNTNDLRIVSILRAVRDGIEAIGYVDTESFLYIKSIFSSKHGDALFRTKWRVNERAGALAKAALSAGHEMATRELAKILTKLERFVKFPLTNFTAMRDKNYDDEEAPGCSSSYRFDDELIGDARFVCALIGEKTASWPLGVPIDVIDRVEEAGARLAMLNASAKAREAGFICLSASSLARSSIFIYSRRRDVEAQKKFENIAFVISSTFDEIADNINNMNVNDLSTACAAAEAVESYVRFAGAAEENGRATKLMLSSLLSACERMKIIEKEEEVDSPNVETVRLKVIFRLRGMNAYASCSKDVEELSGFRELTPQVVDLIGNLQSFITDSQENEKNMLHMHEEIIDDDDFDRFDFGRSSFLSIFLDDSERELLANKHVVTFENGDETVSEAFQDLRLYRGESNAPPYSPSHAYDNSKEVDNIDRKDVFPFAEPMLEQIDQAHRACFTRVVEVVLANKKDDVLQTTLSKLLSVWEERCVAVINESEMLVNNNSSEYRKRHVTLFNHPRKPSVTDFLRCDAAISRLFADIVSVSNLLRSDGSEGSKKHLEMLSRRSKMLQDALSAYAPLETALLCAKCIERTSTDEEVRQRVYNFLDFYTTETELEQCGMKKRSWNRAIECVSLSKAIERIGAISIGEKTLRRFIDGLSKQALEIDFTHRSTHAFAVRALANVAEVCGSGFARDSDRAADLALHLLDSAAVQEALLKNVVSVIAECGHLANAAAIAIGPDLSDVHKVFIKSMNVAAIIRDMQSHSRFQNFRLAVDKRRAKAFEENTLKASATSAEESQPETNLAVADNEFTGGDDVVYAEVVFIQHMAMFAPNAIDLTTIATTLRDALQYYATVPVALETLSFLAVKNAQKLLFPYDNDDTGMTAYTGMTSSKSCNKFAAHILRDVVKCLTKGASRRVKADAKNCARVLAKELSIIDPRCAIAALSAISFDEHRLLDEHLDDALSEDGYSRSNTSGDEIDSGDDDGDEADEKEIDESDIDAERANNHPRLPARIFASTLLSRVPFWVQESNIPEHRSVRQSRLAETPNAYLPTHAQRCFEVAYALSTASASKLRARGLEMMSFLVKLWENDDDPDAFFADEEEGFSENENESSFQNGRFAQRGKNEKKRKTIKTLEQFQAQILSAVRASQSNDSPLDVRVAGARLAANAVAAKVHGTDLSVVKRLQACVIDFANEWPPIYEKTTTKSVETKPKRITALNACCEAVMFRARMAACTCLATVYIQDSENENIPSDIVDLFIPAWTYLLHDMQIIKQSLALTDGAEKQFLDDFLIDKCEFLPAELVLACPSLLQDVSEAFLPCMEASAQATVKDKSRWETIRNDFLLPSLLASLKEPFSSCVRSSADESSNAIERFNPTPDTTDGDSASIPENFLFNTRPSEIRQVEIAFGALQTYDGMMQGFIESTQAFLNEKLGKSTFDCRKSSEAYRRIKDAAIEFLNASASSASASSFIGKTKTPSTVNAFIAGMLKELIEDDVVDALLPIEEKEKKFTNLANLLVSLEKVNPEAFEEIVIERLDSQDSIKANLNSALIALMALDSYVTSRQNSNSEQDVVLLQKLAPPVAVFSRRVAREETNDEDLIVLFVFSALKFLKKCAENDTQNLAANKIAAMFTIAIETIGNEKMVTEASILSNAAVRELPLASRQAVLGMDSSTRLKFKTLLDYSVFTTQVRAKNNDDFTEIKTPGKIALTAFQ